MLGRILCFLWGYRRAFDKSLGYLVIFLLFLSHISLTSYKDWPGKAEHLLKVNSRRVQKGDIVTVKTGGGGGFGNPADRTAEQTDRDRRNEYVKID
jgi:hypothetical protein